MAKQEPADWHVIVNWREDVSNLTETKTRAVFETLKRTLAKVSEGRDYPTIELRQGPVLRDHYEVKPE